MRQQPTNETAGLRPVDEGQPPYLYPDYVATRLRAPKKPLDHPPQDPLGYHRVPPTDAAR